MVYVKHLTTLLFVRQFAYHAAVIAATLSRPRLDHSLLPWGGGIPSLSGPWVWGKEAQLQLLQPAAYYEAFLCPPLAVTILPLRRVELDDTTWAQGSY